EINGHGFEIETGFSKDVDRFWEPIRCWIPARVLKPGANEIVLKLPHENAFISSLHVEVETRTSVQDH
ncbi:MAG: hypothetical protein AAF492_30590, partial [Verrucomicrobiota bacterium]